MSTLKLHATPAGALELVRTNLKAMPRHTYGAVDFAKTEIDEVNIVAYIRVAKATLEIASQKVVLDPDLAHSGVALLDYKSKIVAAAFIDEGTAHDAVGVSQLTFGPLVKHLVDALYVAESDLQGGDFEPALLPVSPLGLNVLRLVASTSNHTNEADFFVPLGPKNELLPAARYDADSLAAALTKALQRSIKAFANSPNGTQTFSD